MFSALILTLNEERDLPGCLASLQGCDDIVVLDSGSTDQTSELARAGGARFFIRPFDNFAAQRNYAQSTIVFRYPWVFHLDADERMTPKLFTECARQATRTDLDGFFAAPKMYWANRWVPHCTDFPSWQARFVRAPQFAFVEVGHGQREAPDQKMGYLRANYLHELAPAGAKGEAEWLEKHRRYARAEAKTNLGAARLTPFRTLFACDPLARRRALKRLSYKLPFRPVLRFIYQYILRRGFLDGRAGFSYCLLLARYESFIAAEVRELKRTRC